MFYKIIRFTIFSISVFIAGSALLVLAFRWINPVSSSFIQLKSGSPLEILSFDTPKHEWVSLGNISPYMPLSVVASEDQVFFDHFGFDFEQIEKAMKENQRRKRQRGASTISQQVAKNMFLFPGKSLFRKGIEAYFTLLIELLWGKKRIIEVYLNIAEMGEDVYGVGAASRLYFKKKPSALSASEAALLTAILPSPIKRSVLRPSGYLINRRDNIMKQMELIGGTPYIKSMVY